MPGGMRQAVLAGAAALAAVLLAIPAGASAAALALKETPMLAPQVAAGKLPPIGERVPEEPSVVQFSGDKTIGRQGGELRTLIGRAKDVRLLVVYGYARLVGYDENFELVPDILKSYEVKEGRQFTFHLRKGHKWSDGAPFTAEDFRYWWEDVANNEKLSPAGPPRDMLVNGKPPKFEVLDPYTVRYTWGEPNPYFLPRLAGASPLFIYRPAHYLKRFHAKYADKQKLAALLKQQRMHNWAAVHNRLDNLYHFDNPALPTLQPWINTSRPPTTRFLAVRNPYYHRVDPEGRQLPYIDKVAMIVSDSKLVPAKAGTGEVDLQARNLSFSNYTFLRQNEERGGFHVALWRIAKGSQVALYPNLNANDPEWRRLVRDVRFRHALSLGIDRGIVNESLYFGMALEANNTVLPRSPLYTEDDGLRWADYDPDRANDLLDELGLTKRNDEGIRLLPDGRPLEIIVETAGESTEEVDVLELIRETWHEIGVKLYIKPSQREVFRNRIFSGEAMMSVWSGLENGVATAASSPDELAPTSQQQLQWPKWGQYYETSGKAGEPADLPGAQELLQLNKDWRLADSIDSKRRIWHRMLGIWADKTYTIGVVSGVKQPVVVKNDLRNVPKTGIYNWDPGAQFGIYRPDTFWFDR